MNTNRFDEISRTLARRGSRRGLVAGALGLAGAFAGNRTLAQDATPTLDPDDPPPSAGEATEDPTFLFVQAFDSGTWTPKPGEDDTYLLTLRGASAQTVYFSDRPDRIVGQVETGQFLDALGFTPANPPNAAIVAEHMDGHDEQEILVIVLLNPVYDPDEGTLTYEATVLADYGEHGLAHLSAQQQDYELGEVFGAGSLFIDDCPNGMATCAIIDADGYETGVGALSGVPCCWSSSHVRCRACNRDGDSNYYMQRCAEEYPADCVGADGSWLCLGKGRWCQAI